LTVLGWHLACPFDSFKVGSALRRLLYNALGKSGISLAGRGWWHHLQFCDQRRDLVLNWFPCCHLPLATFDYLPLAWQGNKLGSNLLGCWLTSNWKLAKTQKFAQQIACRAACVWLAGCLSIHLPISYHLYSIVYSISICSVDKASRCDGCNWRGTYEYANLQTGCVRCDVRFEQ